MPKTPKRRPFLFVAAFFVFSGLLFWGGKQALIHPETPIPSEWNPLEALRVSDPLTPLTDWKLAHAVADPTLCLKALQDSGAAFDPGPDKEESAQCHIRNRVLLRSVGSAQISTLETRCPIALRLAMWNEHGLKPAASRFLGEKVVRVHHIGSYNCRQIRTPSGATGRMSTHATADAVDISGFTLSDGRQLRLIRDWDGADAGAAFLKDAHQSACRWFKTSLGPDYNRLHGDHFHLQNEGWGTCR